MSDYTVVVRPQVSNYTVVVDSSTSQFSVVTANNNGRSAYEEAVANGFVGTVQEWLSSLGAGGSDKNFVFIQTSPSSSWTLNHNLNKYVSIVILDTSGYEVEADIQQISVNQAVINFTPAFAGKAIAN